MGKIVDLRTKECPYCAETIKRRAVICRFCGYDLRTGTPTKPSLASLQEPAQESQVGSEVTSGESLGCGTFIVLSLLLLGGLVLLFVLLSSRRSP
jgi:hypothetical protein